MIANQSEYARRHGVSPTAVRKWISRGWLVLQGSDIDVEKSDARLTTYRDSKDSRATRGKKEVSAGARTKGKVSTQVSGQVSTAVSEADIAESTAHPAKTHSCVAQDGGDESLFLPGETAEEAAERLTTSDGIDMDMPIEEARRIKEVYLALLNRLEYEKKSGDVIDLEMAQTVLFECARGARDAWLNWPSKYAPYIAADLSLESDKVLPVLEEYVYKQIAALGLPDEQAFEGGD